MKEFLKRKNIEISARRYGIDALGAMAQGLFCSLLIGTIFKTLGQQLSIQFLVNVGQFAFDMSGPAMAVAIGYALKADPMVLFSLTGVGWAANALGGAGGPLAVLFIAIIAGECGKLVSKETKVDILVTPAVTVFAGVGLAPDKAAGVSHLYRKRKLPGIQNFRRVSLLLYPVQRLQAQAGAGLQGVRSGSGRRAPFPG